MKEHQNNVCKKGTFFIIPVHNHMHVQRSEVPLYSSLSGNKANSHTLCSMPLPLGSQ